LDLKTPRKGYLQAMLTTVSAVEQRLAVIESAKSWCGTPFHHGAAIKGKRGGVDCGRLLAEVYRDAGVLTEVGIPHFAHDFFLHERTERYLDLVRQHMAEVPVPKAGDLVLFLFGRVYSHGGIVVEWPTIIHANGASSHPQVEIGNALQPPLVGRPTKFFDPFIMD
jgi:cell wall-associated NlpC family hydrolase